MSLGCSFKKIQILTLIIAVVSILTVLLILFFFNYPTVAHDRIIEAMLFKNSTDAIERFRSTKEAKDLRISFYLYNITNADQVINNSAKIKLQEVGPFVYSEYREKIFVDNNQTAGLITYRLLRRYNFDKNLSIANPKDVLITWPNLPLLISRSYLDKLPFVEKKLAYFFLNRAIKNENESPFMTDTVDNFLFSGSRRQLFEYLQSKDIFKIIKPWPLKDNKFGLFYGRNYTWDPTTMVELTASAGFGKNHTYRDLNKVVYVNGTSTTNYWPQDPEYCNQVDGTDGQFFSPFLGEPSNVYIYAADLCRKLSFKLSQPTYIKGLSALEYKLDEDDLQSWQRNPKNKCYCLRRLANGAPDPECGLDGLMDLSSCASPNLLASGSHFALGSPELRKRVDGIREPDQTDHPAIFIEPITGLAVKASVPTQLNVRIEKGGFDIFSFFNESQPLIVPFIWMVEGTEITGDQGSLLKTELLLLDSWLVSLVLGAAIFLILAVLLMAGVICLRYRNSEPINTGETDPLLPRLSD